MNEIAALFALQQIDTARDQHYQRLVEIKALLGESDEVRAAQAALTQAQAQLDAFRRQRNQLAEEAKTLRAKRKREEDRLYSGTVKNPKELQDLQAEIASLDRHAAEFDDRQLEVMIEIEDAEALVNAAQTRLDQHTATWKSAQTDLLQAQQQHQTELDELNTRRQTTLEKNPISAPTLQKYQTLRQTKRGLAVTRLSPKGVCGACGLAVHTARRQQAANAPGIVTCDNCGRIWFVE